MSKYTYELNELINQDIVIFNENFPFYTDDVQMREDFIEKFNSYYYFNEIGFEEIDRFVLSLNNKMKVIIPYYKKIYETELKSKGIDFLKIKNWSETYTSDKTGKNTLKDDENISGNTSDTTSSNSRILNREDVSFNELKDKSKNGLIKGTRSEDSESKISQIPDGLSQIDTSEGFLTGETKDNRINVDTTIDEETNTENNNGSSTKNSNSTNDRNDTTSGTKTETKNKTRVEDTTGLENYTRNITGNDGADYSILIKNWRDIVIDIDYQLIKELRDLFMYLID